MPYLERLALTIGIFSLFPLAVFGCWGMMIAASWEPSKHWDKARQCARSPLTQPVILLALFILIVATFAFAFGASLEFWRTH